MMDVVKTTQSSSDESLRHQALIQRAIDVIMRLDDESLERIMEVINDKAV